MKSLIPILVIGAFLGAGCVGSADPTLLPEEDSDIPTAALTTPALQEEESLSRSSTSTPETEKEGGEDPMGNELYVPEGSEPLVELAMWDLAERLKIEPESITLTYLKPITWPDATLGCGKPGMDYTPIETPGYIIQLSATGKDFTYHTDDADRVIFCPGEGERPDEIFIMP